MIRSLPVAGLDAEYIEDVGILEALDIEGEDALATTPDKSIDEDMIKDSELPQDHRMLEGVAPPHDQPLQPTSQAQSSIGPLPVETTSTPTSSLASFPTSGPTLLWRGHLETLSRASSVHPEAEEPDVKITTAI